MGKKTTTKKKLIPKIKIGPKGRINRLPLGTGMLRQTVDIIKKRQKKQINILKELEK